jgi:hypothetical protein
MSGVSRVEKSKDTGMCTKGTIVDYAVRYERILLGDQSAVVDIMKDKK